MWKHVTERIQDQVRILYLLIKVLTVRIQPRRRRNFKTQQSAIILDFFFKKTRSGKSYDYRDYCTSFFLNTQFPKCYPSTRIRKSAVFQFLCIPENVNSSNFYSVFCLPFSLDVKENFVWFTVAVE